MRASDSSIRSITDTAQWAASYRAEENERKDPLFRDPYARRLAGERGAEIMRSMGEQNRNEWAWVTRTFLFDQLITASIARGTNLVVNLAAGLDARPYRMELPASLCWVEIDMPELLAYKESILKDDKPRCGLERVPLDLADVPARRALFQRLGGSGARGLIITEGFLIYLSGAEVGALAQDLAATQGFLEWTFDLSSPGLLNLLNKTVGEKLKAASAPLQFAPEEGPPFFQRFGWRPVEVRSLLKTAARARRVSLVMRLVALLPDSKTRQGSRPWSAVCLAERS